MRKEGLFPSTELEKNTYYNTSVPHLNTNMERLRVSEDNKVKINKDLEEWNVLYPLSLDVDNRTKAIVANKLAAMERIETNLRSVYGDIPQSALTIDDRRILHLELRSTTRTPAPVPTTFPRGQVVNTNLLQHTIVFTDEDGKRGKPEKVRGCQIFCKEGSAPEDEKEMRLLASDASSPYLHKFLFADVGKTFYYKLRWENTRGETGPWGPTISGVVTG